MRFPLHVLNRSVIAPLAQAACVGLFWPTHAGADAVTHLLNFTVRPRYHFANTDQVLAYGRALCDKVAADEGHGPLVVDAKADFNTADERPSAPLINQAVNLLCPQLIWQLQTAAAHYHTRAS
jgi:hypothetical protein